MSTVTSSDEQATPGPPHPGRRPFTVPAVLAAAWLVPAAAHLVGVDALLVPLVVAGLMSLQRGGRSLLDRFVLAVLQLFGAACVAGLAFSVWPWRLHPVPIAGCAFTALVALALATGRRPSLPSRMHLTDRLVAVAALVVALLAVAPFALRDLGGRVGLLAPGEDMARHFLVYDMIGRIGGYAFLHADEARAFMPPELASGISNYPQGVHFSYALLDRFLRSADHSADGVTAMDILIWLHVATFAFFALAVLWAARRVAGPGPGVAALLPVTGGVAAYLYFGDPVSILVRGFPNELVGLAVVAVLTALVVRPLPAHGEQIVTVALLLVGLSFAYHLFAPYAALVAAAWAWRHRRDLLRRRRTVAGAALLLPFAAITPLTIRAAASGEQLVAPGTALINDRPAAVALIVLVAAGLTARRGLRSPARRAAAVTLAAALAEVGALAAYQYATVGRTVYYFEKTVHMLLVVALVGLGTVARLVPRAPAPPAPGRPRRPAPPGYGRPPRPVPPGPGRLRRFAVPAALLAVSAMLPAVAGGPTHTRPAGPGLRLVLGVEAGSPTGGRDAILMARRYPDGGGKANVALMHTPYANVFGTLFGSAMQRDYRHGHAWYLFLYPPGPRRTPADLERMVLDSDVGVRFFVADPDASFLVADPDHPRGEPHDPTFTDPTAPTTIDAVEALARKYPDRVEVVHVPSGASA